MATKLALSKMDEVDGVDSWTWTNGLNGHTFFVHFVHSVHYVHCPSAAIKEACIFFWQRTSEYRIVSLIERITKCTKFYLI